MAAAGESLMLRQVRIVPVTTPAPPGPVDVRIEHGRVREIAPHLSGSTAAEVAAEGRWLIPGLWDQHVHLSQWAAMLGRLDLAGCRSPQEVCQRVAAGTAASTAAVLQGFGYRSGAWDEQPSVAALDAVSDGRPVILISGDAHNGWLNSAALAFFGLPERAGALTEDEWFALWARLDELPRDPARERSDYAEAVRRAAATGLVGLTDLELARGWQEWPERYAAGVDQLRVRVATYPPNVEEVIGLGLRSGDPLTGTAGQVRMGPLKIITDGSLNTRTAYCHTAYAGGHGILNIGREELSALMSRGHRAGLRIAAHAIGDAALSNALDAFAASGAAGSIEHAQLVDLADLPRMAALGVVASVQPAHLLDDRDVTEQLWPDRAERCFAFRSMLQAGVELAMGSDAPVAPLDPWLAMAAAVHRSADDRAPWNSAQALTAREALAASTDGAGTVAVGSVADLALLDADPLPPQPDSAAAARALRGVAVAVSLVAGRITHDAR